MKGNITLEKSYAFSLEIITLYQKLKEIKEFDIAKQILRSGTSIGANVNEAQSAVSNNDFINKLSIGLKEAKETQYWLRLLKDSLIMESSSINPLLKANLEIIKILSKTIITLKAK